MKSFITVYALGFSLAVFAGPVGEKAHYQVDLDPKRTSSMIKGGTMDVSVTQFIEAEDSDSYELKIDYKYKIQFVGNKEGSQLTQVDAAYFDPSFLDELRKNGTYEGPNFKAKHMGYADAKTLNGKVYPNCDKIHLYDIKQDSTMGGVMREWLSGDARADIQDLTALVHVSPGVPVLGGVKMDVAGKYQGIPVKAGGDYIK